MSRHVIIGRLGSKDKIAVPTGIGEVATQLQFVPATKRLDFGIGLALDHLAKLNLYPNEIGVDLLILAAHIHAADTRISRDSESQDNWTREIRLVVPVSDARRWQNATSVLRRMLNFLTGDLWTVDFRIRPAGFEATVKPRPLQFANPPFDDLALFSGGLDSLIGAIDCLEPGRTPLFISHAGEAAVSAAQDNLFHSLQRHYSGRAFDRLRIWMSFPEGLVKDVPSEKTTRARSFLFFAEGVFASTGLDRASTLRVPENGLIALNVPLDLLRLGALSTRTTPRTRLTFMRLPWTRVSFQEFPRICYAIIKGKVCRVPERIFSNHGQLGTKSSDRERALHSRGELLRVNPSVVLAGSRFSLRLLAHRGFCLGR